MQLVKLKSKNQITIPKEITKRLNMKPNDLFSVDIEDNYIKLILVDVEPKYTPEELQVMDRIVKQEKNTAKMIKPGNEFSNYIKKINK
mgnify:CR=1 FL=1